MLSIYFYLYIINMDIKLERLKMVELSILEEASLLEENDYIFDSDVTKLIGSGSEFEGEVVTVDLCHRMVDMCSKKDYEQNNKLTKDYKVGWKIEGEWSHNKHRVFGVFSKKINNYLTGFELDKGKFNFPPIGMNEEWLDKKIKLSNEIDYSGYNESIFIDNPIMNNIEEFNAKQSRLLRTELERKMIGYGLIGQFISSSTNPCVYDITTSLYSISPTSFYDLRQVIQYVTTIKVKLPDNITPNGYNLVKRTILDELGLFFRFPQDIMELVYKELSKENFNTPMNLDIMLIEDKTIYVVNIFNIKTGKAVNFIKSLLRRHCKRKTHHRWISGSTNGNRYLNSKERAICELYSTAYIQTLRGVDNAR